MTTPRPLAVNITITLTIGLTAVMLLLALYMNREIRREVYGLMSQKDNSLLALQANNATLPLWNFDTKQLQAIVDNIANGEGIQQARIISTESGIEVFAEHPAPLDPEYQAPPLEQDIVFNDGGKTVTLGRLIIVPNYAEIAIRIKKLFLRTLLGLGALLVLLVGIVYVVTHRAIAPLARLSAFMATSSTSAPPIEKTGSSVIEVQQLFSALHKMQDSYLKYQKELMAEKENAERASRVKSDFLAIMSHELRTPLNSILGLSNMFIQDTSLAAEHHDMAAVIRKASVVLLNIINDILDISKIESESLKLENIPFDLRDTIANVMQTLLPIASSKGLSLSSTFTPPDFPALISGDPIRIGRILTNLIGNAVKYTETGSVHAYFDLLPMEGEENKIEFYCRVTDTGIGIPANKLDVIFEKFTQADESITRKFGGTGLGLAISKELISLMGGMVGVESTVGKGSTFWFRIPLVRAKESDLALFSGAKEKQKFIIAASRKNIADVGVLLAEDHLLNQVFMKKLLGRLGIKKLDIKENGQLALQAFEQGGYDLILMDCHMPEMNGYDATRAIRSHEKINGGHIPIIAMTADAMVGTREKCLETGMDNYLSKPVDIDEFKAMLNQWFIFPDKNDSGSPVKKNPETREGEQPYVNISALRNYADTPEEARTFIEVFTKQSEIDLKLLREQCTDGENQSWKEIAHRLKGACGVAGAVVMHHLCMEAQEMLVATKVERVEKCSEIESAYEKTKAYFQSVAT